MCQASMSGLKQHRFKRKKGLTWISSCLYPMQAPFVNVSQALPTSVIRCGCEMGWDGFSTTRTYTALHKSISYGDIAQISKRNDLKVSPADVQRCIILLPTLDGSLGDVLSICKNPCNRSSWTSLMELGSSCFRIIYPIT